MLLPDNVETVTRREYFEPSGAAPSDCIFRCCRHLANVDAELPPAMRLVKCKLMTRELSFYVINTPQNG